jgi:outer membrane protein OmpA-like peptidoglycan-associated protein
MAAPPVQEISPVDSEVSIHASAPDVVTTELPREPGSRALPTTAGPVGLLRLSTAEVGAPMQLRVGLTSEFFSTSDFLIGGDRDLRLAGALAVGFTPLKFLEVFGSFSAAVNRNRRICTTGPGGTTCTSEANRNDPEVIKSYGDITLGSKFAYPLSGGVSAGAEVGLRFLASVTGISFDPGATSVWVSGLGGWDMRPMGAPLRAHLMLGLYFDNSEKVVDYTNVSRPSKAVSQFAYGIAKDRVRTGLGLEWLIENLGGGIGVHPFAEYHLEMITADADPAFRDYQPPLCNGSNMSAGGQPCRDNRDQQWLTLGLRVQGRGGFTVGAGVDVTLHAVGFPYGPPLAPWNVSLGLAYPLDLAAPKLVTRTVTVEKRIPVEPKPTAGSVLGKVINAVGGAPIEGAIVAVPGRTKGRVATDPDGTFRAIGLPPGVADLEVVATDFEPAQVRAAVVAGQEAPVTIILTPRVRKAKVSGRVTDDKGKAVAAATLRFAGPQNAELKSDETGTFATQLNAGDYVVRVEADHFMPREMKVTLSDGKDQDLSTAVRARPTVTRVIIRNGRLSLRQAVNFKGSGPAATEISPAAASLLDEVADTLGSHPEVKRLRIEAHWDSSLSKDKAQDLTDEQAKSIATYLAKQGVAENRLEAVGMGAQRPLVPNIGPAKLRNRRVEFRLEN